MKRTTSINIFTICATGMATMLLFSGAVAAQNTKTKAAPTYNPYPPAILPGDLNSEMERVLREVDIIEGRALTRWHALAPQF